MTEKNWKQEIDKVKKEWQGNGWISLHRDGSVTIHSTLCDDFDVAIGIIFNLAEEHFKENKNTIHIAAHERVILDYKEEISQLKAKIKESKKRDIWHMTPEQIDEVVQRNRYRLVPYDELKKEASG